MSDEHAFLRAILARPNDDTTRLVYADWLEEHPTDRRLATAEFVRLTCGLREPKRAKTKVCPDCRGWTETGHDEDGEATEDVETVETCGTCNGTGRVPNGPPTHRLFPKHAADWLKVNWRRLVPELTRDWDHKLAKERRSQDVNTFPEHVRWDTRSRMTTLVPFVLPIAEDIDWMLPADVQERLYSPVVRLIFDRGFVEYASWQAPRLGPMIAARLARDQPAAVQHGPGWAYSVGQAPPGEEGKAAEPGVEWWAHEVVA